MRRGEIWTVAGGKDYAGKPRPVVIVQDDCFDATDSITICAFNFGRDASASVPASRETKRAYRAAHDVPPDGGKITTVPKSKVGRWAREQDRRGLPSKRKIAVIKSS